MSKENHRCNGTNNVKSMEPTNVKDAGDESEPSDVEEDGQPYMIEFDAKLKAVIDKLCQGNAHEICGFTKHCRDVVAILVDDRAKHPSTNDTFQVGASAGVKYLKDSSSHVKPIL